MANDLESRYDRFLRSLPGAEAIDDLSLPADPVYKRKSDFLLAERKVIVELKTLTADPGVKIEAEMDRHRDRPDFPLFFGTAALSKILQHLPDGDAINKRILNSLGRAVESHVRSAEEQIQHTRRRLGLPNGIGLLIILNADIAVLDPNVIAHRVASTSRRPRSGRTEWPVVDACLIVDESNLLQLDNRPPAFTSLWLENRKGLGEPWFSRFKDQLTAAWATFNNLPELNHTESTPSLLRFIPTAEANQVTPKRMKRQELWEIQYAAKPYLRELTDTDLLTHGQRLIQRIAPGFMKGGPSLTQEVIRDQMECFTHFMSEMTHRGLDWRLIPKGELSRPART